MLFRSKDEEMSVGKRSATDVASEEERLEELLEAARVAGLSTAGLDRAKKMVCEKARDIWRLKLGRGDVADLPAMPVELKKDASPLPKPYMRRYSSAEMAYWRIVIDELLETKVIRDPPFRCHRGEPVELGEKESGRRMVDHRVPADHRLERT